MEEKKVELYTREELLALGIYDLRELGREVGVASPTTQKKEKLVDSILGIIYGDVPKQKVGKTRGRPVRVKDKQNNTVVNLINQIEKPKCDTVFIHSGESDFSSFCFGDMLSTKVASARTDYVNDQEEESGLKLIKAVVSEENDVYYARKFKFIKSELDYIIPKHMVEEYGIQDNDLIEYLPDDADNVLVQIFKINGEIVANKTKKLNKSIEHKEVDIENYRIKTNSSNVIYVPLLQDRQRLVDDVCLMFDNMNYSTIKVCFDRGVSEKKSAKINKVEVFSSCIGENLPPRAGWWSCSSR